MQGPHTGVMHRHNAAAHDNWRSGEGKIGAPPKSNCLKSNADDQHTDEKREKRGKHEIVDI